MSFDYLKLIQTEPEPIEPLPDYSAEIEARHAKLRAEHEATWGPRGMGCGCARCREGQP